VPQLRWLYIKIIRIRTINRWICVIFGEVVTPTLN
jgi:hypothetical protein